MRLLNLSGAIAAFLAVSASAAPPARDFEVVKRTTDVTTVSASTSTAYLPPSQDPWYRTSKSSLTKKKNGTVVKVRKVSTAFDQLANTYQLLYRTNDAQLQPDASNTLLFAPLQALSPPRIVVALAPADTAAVDCSVQYSLFSNTESNVTSAATSITVLSALSKGYYVVVPDHEGSKAAFSSGLTEARATLDGLRAALNFQKAFASGTKGYKAVITGYSGGGHAAAWATQFLGCYGKGLNVVGTSMGGVPIDLYYTSDLLNGSPNVGLGFAAIAGIANADPKFNTWLKTHLYKNGTAAIAYARSNEYCVDATADPNYPWAGADTFSTIKGGEFALRSAVAKATFEANTLGKKSAFSKGVLPKIPVHMFHAKNDELVAYAPVKPYFIDQCNKGAKIHLATSSGTTYAETFLVFLGDTMRFIQQAFDGKAGIDECRASISPDTTLLSAEYMAAVGQLAGQQILAATQAGARVRF